MFSLGKRRMRGGLMVAYSFLTVSYSFLMVAYSSLMVAYISLMVAYIFLTAVDGFSQAAKAQAVISALW